MTRYGLDIMADNTAVTVITESRNLKALPFMVTEDQLSTGKAWEDWLEAIEREFRYFRITEASDRKDALIIYGGQEISRLEKSLPDPEGRGLNLYEKIRTKLNDYFVPKKNKHYCRYMFLKMRPRVEETTVAYATRLREKAKDCDFKTNQDERILEHLIQTIENQTLIQKCISKSWTLQEFLSEAGQIETISEQVHDMKADPWSREVAKVAVEGKNMNSRNSDIGEKSQAAEPCNYCGLSGVHPRGRNCPAYGVQCETCKRFNHFSSVCRANTSRNDARYVRPMTPGHHEKRRIMKAEEIDFSEESSDDEFLAQSVGHLRVKTVRKSNNLNGLQSTEIGIIQERVTQLESELKVAQTVIQHLVAQQQNHQYHPLMKRDCMCLPFKDKPRLQSLQSATKKREIKTDPERIEETNEKREMKTNTEMIKERIEKREMKTNPETIKEMNEKREMKTDQETIKERNKFTTKLLVISDNEILETQSRNQHQNFRIQKDDKQITSNKMRGRSRRKRKRH